MDDAWRISAPWSPAQPVQREYITAAGPVSGSSAASFMLCNSETGPGAPWASARVSTSRLPTTPAASPRGGRSYLEGARSALPLATWLPHNQVAAFSSRLTEITERIHGRAVEAHLEVDVRARAEA